jgi:tankyrase
VIQALFAKGAHVNDKNKYEITPLHEAARSGSFEVVKLLVGHGADADISAKDNLVRTSLIYAKEF